MPFSSAASPQLSWTPSRSLWILSAISSSKPLTPADSMNSSRLRVTFSSFTRVSARLPT